MVKRYQKKKENHVPTSFLHKNLIKKCSGPNTSVLPWRAGKNGGKIDHSRPSDQKWLFNYLPSHLTFFFFGKVIPMGWVQGVWNRFFPPARCPGHYWTLTISLWHNNDHRVGCSWSLAAVVEFFYKEYKKDYRHVINFPGARRPLCWAISVYIFGNDIFCWVGTISVEFRFFFVFWIVPTAEIRDLWARKTMNTGALKEQPGEEDLWRQF